MGDPAGRTSRVERQLHVVFGQEINRFLVLDTFVFFSSVSFFDVPEISSKLNAFHTLHGQVLDY
jgi:hypothetical protein